MAQEETGDLEKGGDEISNETNNEQTSETALDKTKLETDIAKVELEKAKIQAQISSGWQKVIAEFGDRLEKYSTTRASREARFTTTLTASILGLLVIIIGTLAVLTWKGIVTGESLLFFLGTLAGSVVMLVAERIKSQR